MRWRWRLACLLALPPGIIWVNSNHAHHTPHPLHRRQPRCCGVRVGGVCGEWKGEEVNIANWITGLMRHNYEAVGFIPEPTVQHRYVTLGRYILQTDDSGHNIGYLLHGALRRAQPVVISQHLIDYDYRRRHYGLLAFNQFVERCERVGVSSIHLRVADDLPALLFWQSCGFQTLRIVPGGERRQRSIVEMYRPFDLPLLSAAWKGLNP